MTSSTLTRGEMSLIKLNLFTLSLNSSPSNVSIKFYTFGNVLDVTEWDEKSTRPNCGDGGTLAKFGDFGVSHTT